MYQQPAPPPYPVQPGYPYPPPPSPRKIALQYGLIAGAILVVCYLLYVGINLVVSRSLPALMMQFHLSISAASTLLFALTAVFTLIYWVIYFLAGLFAARRARQVKTATIACLWMSLCFLVVLCLVQAITIPLTLMEISRLSPSLQTGYIGNIARSLVITLVLQIGLGIGVGALGGLVGRNLAPKRDTPMPPMYG